MRASAGPYDALVVAPERTASLCFDPLRSFAKFYASSLGQQGKRQTASEPQSCASWRGVSMRTTLAREAGAQAPSMAAAVHGGKSSISEKDRPARTGS